MSLPDDFRLPLKQGDLIKTTVQSVDKEGVKRGDPTPWRGVNELKIVEDRGDLAVGSEAFVSISNTDGRVVEAIRERAPYMRDHHPGDTVTVETGEAIGPKVCRGKLSEFRNLDQIYVVGSAPLTALDAEIRKIRNGAGFSIPKAIREPGLEQGSQVEVKTVAKSKRSVTMDGDIEIHLDEWVPNQADAVVEVTTVDDPMKGELVDKSAIPQEGDEVEVKTVGKSNRAITVDDDIEIHLDEWVPNRADAVVEVTAVDDPVEGKLVDKSAIPQVGEQLSGRAKQGEESAILSNSSLKLTLDTPAPCTGVFGIRLTNVSSEGLEGTIVSEPKDIPDLGDKLTTTVRRGASTVEFEFEDIHFEATTSHETPITGEAIFELEQRNTDEYTVALHKYTDPNIEQGDTIEAAVSKPKQRAVATVDGSKVNIRLTGDVPKSGKATVLIEDIEEYLTGKIVGAVERPSGDREGGELDTRNLSKL